MQVYEVKKGQNIFDVAIAVYGSIEGVFDLLVNNPELSFDYELTEGEELYYDEQFVVYDSIVNTLTGENITPVNGERHVYYKEVDAELRCILSVSASDAYMKLSLAGDGIMIVDWGDNSEIETIELQATTQDYLHFYDNETDKRVVRLYGDFNIKTWDLSTIANGMVLPVQPLTVDEVVVKKNNITLDGLFLFKGTYSVVLDNISLSSLNMVRDMSLQELTVTNIESIDGEKAVADIMDEYLIYVAQNNNERRNCTVKTDIQPSGEYQEPSKDDNGNYVIETGMEAVYVICHEEAWNEAGSWVFEICGEKYSFE